jgi:DNA-binding NarL/FixJ family response regulator
MSAAPEIESATARVAVLLLEPDPWRFRGMSVVLEDSGDVKVVGDRDFSTILTTDRPPDGVEPDVCVIAHRLVVEFGLGVIPHIKDLFHAPVLVHGDQESLNASAELLAAGASGYFNLTSPPGYLAKAVTVVAHGKMWGPREAVAMMAQRVIERKEQEPQMGGTRDFSADDLLLLRYLHDGLSNKEIASHLHVAEVTVKTRLGRLYKRFGVNTRLQLLSAAIREGLVV